MRRAKYLICVVEMCALLSLSVCSFIYIWFLFFSSLWTTNIGFRVINIFSLSSRNHCSTQDVTLLSWGFNLHALLQLVSSRHGTQTFDWVISSKKKKIIISLRVSLLCITRFTVTSLIPHYVYELVEKYLHINEFIALHVCEVVWKNDRKSSICESAPFNSQVVHLCILKCVEIKYSWDFPLKADLKFKRLLWLLSHLFDQQQYFTTK